jgi:tetratricopeptide (TPR) repeat protein
MKPKIEIIKCALVFFLLAYTSVYAQETPRSRVADMSAGIKKINELQLKAETLYQEGKYAEAEGVAKEALVFAEGLFRQEIDLDGVLSQLGSIYYAELKYEDAIHMFERRYEILRNYLGENHPETNIAADQVALLYKAAGRLSDAEKLFKKIIEIVRKEAGEISYEHAVLLSNLADVYAAENQFEKAEPLLQQVLVIYEKKFGKDGAETKEMTRDIAAFYEKNGKRAYRQRAENVLVSLP